MSNLTHKLIEKMKIQRQICLGLIMLLFFFSATCVSAADILFVVGKKDLRPGDLCIKNHLEQRGYDVTVVVDEEVSTEYASDRDLVFLSESARSRFIGDKFRDVAVPVICSEPWIFNGLGMTGNARKKDYGRKSRQKELIMIESDHPLCASCSGEVRVCTKNFYMGWGLPGENAIAVAGLTNEPDKCTIFAYEAGVKMPGLVAPARRVGFFMFRDTASNFTTEGWSLFDSAVDWSMSEPPTAQSSTLQTQKSTD
jgi:hypothetical protein